MSGLREKRNRKRESGKMWEDVVGDGVTGSGAKITSLAVMTVMVEGDGNGEIGFKGEK